MTAAVAQRSVVVLAHAHDRGAVAVSRAIADRHGDSAVHVVQASELGRAPRWSHAIDARGSVTGDVALQSGTVLAADGIGCVFNRLVGIVPPAFARAPARERDYAAAEMHALLVSWLAGLGRPVINPVAGLFGNPSRRQWLTRAVAAGIPVMRDVVATSARLVPSELSDHIAVRGPWPETKLVSRQPVEASPAPGRAIVAVLVAGHRAHGDVSRAIGHRCVDLARQTGRSLLQLDFAVGPRGVRLAHVDPMPPLVHEHAVAVVADLLEHSSVRPR